MRETENNLCTLFAEWQTPQMTLINYWVLGLNFTVKCWVYFSREYFFLRIRSKE